MLSVEQEQELKTFFKALEDHPLEADDPRYVNELHQSPKMHIDPIKDYLKRLDWSDRTFSSMITGQRGAGKSTELRRLQKHLIDARYTVFLIDLSEYLNPNQPLDITDFLLTVLGALSDAVEAQFGTMMLSESYWERCHQLLTKEVKLETNVKSGAELKINLKEDPSFKRKIQTVLKESLSHFLASVHTFVDLVVRELEIQVRGKGVVVLIDSLEKIRGIGEDGRKVHESIRNLFVENAKHLVLPKLNMVYSVPAYLAFLAPSVNAVFGTSTWSLANTHVYQKNGKLDDDGLKLMRELITKRYDRWPTIISEEDLNSCIAATGGDLRDLFRMLRHILVSAAQLEQLPVPNDLILEVERLLRREMLPLTNEDLAWLKRIHQTKECHLETLAELDRLAQYFDGNRVQCYRNGEDWYDVHPLLRPVILRNEAGLVEKDAKGS